MEKKAKIAVLFGVCVGAAGIGCALYSAHELSLVRRLIGGATDKISEISQIEIDQKIVDRAVAEAVRVKSRDAVTAAAEKARKAVEDDIRNRVKQAVERDSGKIYSRVSEKLSEELSRLNRDDIVDEVVKQTTESLAEKLAKDLDDEVSRLGKIYQGIAAALK